MVVELKRLKKRRGNGSIYQRVSHDVVAIHVCAFVSPGQQNEPVTVSYLSVSEVGREEMKGALDAEN